MNPLLRLSHPMVVLALLLNLLLIVTVVCLAALLLSRYRFAHDPSRRYAVCLTALGCIALSPLLVGIQGSIGASLITLPLPGLGLSSTVPADFASDSDIIGIAPNVGSIPSLPLWITSGVEIVVGLWLLGILI